MYLGSKKKVGQKGLAVAPPLSLTIQQLESALDYEHYKADFNNFHKRSLPMEIFKCTSLEGNLTHETTRLKCWKSCSNCGKYLTL